MNKYYAIADLHGMYNLWRQVIEYLDESDTLYILGDCADRGPEGWKIIKEALADPRIIYIRGNHDQMLIDAMKHPWGYDDISLWYWNGGQITHDNMIDDEKYEIYLNQLIRTRHSATYVNLNGQKIYLTHAGFTPSDKMPCGEDLLWDRDHIADNWPEGRENEYVVHGHTYCASHSYFGSIDTKLNDTKTVGKYCDGHKICIDGRSFLNNRVALLNLDTLKETVFIGEEQK